MLSVGMLSAGDETYFVELASERCRADEYYTAGAEPPGVWMGSGSPSLGLEGVVDPPDLRAVLGGRHPQTGELLLVPAVLARRRRPGMYLTFSAPKGVSLIGLLGDDRVAGEVRDAHRHAVAAALGHMEREALFARRGRDGQVRVATGGFVAAGFEHSTSRAGDPQLHIHVLVANLVQGVDGEWSTPDSRTLFRYARTGGFVYQAALRAELTARLGVEWGPVRSGMAEPAGIPTSVLREFSTRRRQIEDHLARRGQSSAAAAQVAANTTRRAKDHSVSVEVLRESWRVQAAAAGFDLVQIRALCHPEVERVPLTGRSTELVDALVGPSGLTTHASTFDRRDLTRAVAERAVEGASPTEIEAIADRVVTDQRVVPVTPVPPAAGSDPGEPPALHVTEQPGPGQERWTTVDLLDTEAAVLDCVLRRQHSNPAPVADIVLRASLEARPTLTAEQADAVTALVAGSEGVAVLVGRAGTGKTYALDAARAAWQTAGRVVIGAAPSARAAAELQAGSGIASTTLARLLIDAEPTGPESGLPRGGVVVVDEAGMAGTRTLHRLVTAAERDGTKVVLVGDPAQLPEIEAGGMLQALAARLDAPELSDNRRQIEPWERAALADLRAGRAGDAVVVYRDRGRLTLAATAPDAHRAMVEDWWQARVGGATAAMFALRRSDVEVLNQAARRIMAGAGRLGGDELTVAGRVFAAGDEVVALRNDRRLGVVNGTRATVTAISHDPRRGLTILCADGTERDLPAQYLEDGHLDYGYATTLHKGQGATFDRALLLGSEALYREAGYVGLSRGRVRNDLYVVAGSDDPETHEHGTAQNGHTDPVVELAQSLSRSRAQTLATQTGRPGPGPSTTLADLHRLRAGDIDGPTRRPAVEGELLRRAFEERRHVLVRAALADPGQHLTERLGPPPAAGIARARWARAAETVECYRDRWQITGPATLGAEPDNPEQRVDRGHAHQVVGETRRQLGLEPRAVSRDLGIGL